MVTGGAYESGADRRCVTMAVWRRKPDQGLVQHSDRGSQYAGDQYRKQLARYGMICSMSGKGNCCDNAVVERFLRNLKSERIDHRVYRTREAAKLDIINFIEMFYNSQRLHFYLGCGSPNGYESRAQIEAA